MSDRRCGENDRVKHHRRFHLPEGFRRAWLHSERPVPRLIVRPLERFLDREEGSASLLMLAAIAALVWANSGGDSYERVWSARILLDVGPITLDDTLRHFINELLMAVFFYVVAIEVKRELIFGSLREGRSAAVPVAAAFGSMVGAGLTYVAFNIGEGGDMSGWAIPIATDIAFAIGVLGLAGRRAPRELRTFLLTLAVVDDLASIAIIAIFFTEDISAIWVLGALVIALAVFIGQRIRIRSLLFYVALAGALWIAVFHSGVHGTIAGVITGFLTPARSFYSRKATSELIAERMGDMVGADVEESEGAFLQTARLAQEAVSPLVRTEVALHPWSSYAILPLFALSNAGVPVSAGDLADALSGQIGLGIFVALVIGSPLGGFLFAWASVRFGPFKLAESLDWHAIGSVTPLKGIGFTVAIFITGLTFEGELQEEAVLAVLAASAAAAVIGLTLLFMRHALVRAVPNRAH